MQRGDSRLVKVQSVGLAAFGPINPHSAVAADTVAAFGDPSSIEERGTLCTRTWGDLGLTIEFAAAGGGHPCAQDARLLTLRVAGAAAAEAGWRTAEGIRPRMSVAAARRIYPGARRTGRRLVLVRGPASSESDEIVTVLAARTARGELAELAFPLGE